MSASLYETTSAATNWRWYSPTTEARPFWLSLVPTRRASGVRRRRSETSSSCV